MNELKRHALIKQMQAEFMKLAQLLSHLDNNLNKGKGTAKKAA